jgi:hypothetical protein
MAEYLKRGAIPDVKADTDQQVSFAGDHTAPDEAS